MPSQSETPRKQELSKAILVVLVCYLAYFTHVAFVELKPEKQAAPFKFLEVGDFKLTIRLIQPDTSTDPVRLAINLHNTSDRTQRVRFIQNDFTGDVYARDPMGQVRRYVQANHADFTFSMSYYTPVVELAPRDFLHFERPISDFVSVKDVQWKTQSDTSVRLLFPTLAEQLKPGSTLWAVLYELKSPAIPYP